MMCSSHSCIAIPSWLHKVLFLAIILIQSVQLSAQNSTQNLRQSFLNPPDDARPIMRWWWFGPSVVKPELQKELLTMKDAGIGGVEIQPVYPLVLDGDISDVKNYRYLSQEFLSNITFANTTAHSLGMRVDITLGSGWPYGGPHTPLSLAAGRLKVLAQPITTLTIPAPYLDEGDTLIAVFTITGSEKSFNPTSAQRVELNSAAPANAKTILYFIASHTRQMVKRPADGAEGYVLDHFSRTAIDTHILSVATPLLNAFGSQPPYSVFSDSLEVYGSDWTPNLPAEFQKRRGYDLIPHLPELYAGGTQQAEAVRHDWGQTLSELVRENYLVPLAAFAKAHHTLFRSQTYGEPAVTLADEAASNLPEGEGPQWRAFSFTRWASSASHLYNRNITSAETWTWLHSPAFRATPLDMKVEADRMFLLGVNQFVGHGFPYSPPNLDEPGWSFYAAAVFNAHNPWFPVMPDVTKYLQRVSWLLRQGKPANDVAILLPEDDSQASFTLGHVSITDEIRKRITPEFMSAILDAGYNIDYIDAATIQNLDAIPYPILILPATDRIPLATYKKIADYADTRGKVIAIDRLTSRTPGLLDQESSLQIAALSAQLFHSSSAKGIFLTSVNDLPNALHAALPPDVDTDHTISELGFIHRKLTNSDVYYVVNSTNKPISGSIHFRTDHHDASIETWNPDTGTILPTTGNSNSGVNRIALSLAPYESRIFVLNHHATQITELKQSIPMPEMRHTDISSGWRIHFTGRKHSSSHSLNKLVSWTELPDMQNYSGEAVYSRIFLVRPSKIPDIWINFGDGAPTIDTRPPNASGIYALLDPPIREAAILYVNGTRVGSLWHPPYRINITKYVHQGQNRIELHVYNTAINHLAAQPRHDYTALWAKYGHRFNPQDMDNLQPIPSGLTGPIYLEEQ